MQSLRRIPTFYSDCLIVVIIMMDWNWSMVHVVSKNANSVSLDTVQCVMFRAILAFCQATSVKFPLCVVVSRNLPHRRDDYITPCACTSIARPVMIGHFSIIYKCVFGARGLKQQLQNLSGTALGHSSTPIYADD